MLVEQGPDEQRERVAAEQLVRGVVLGDAQLWHLGSVRHVAATVSGYGSAARDSSGGCCSPAPR